MGATGLLLCYLETVGFLLASVSRRLKLPQKNILHFDSPRPETKLGMPGLQSQALLEVPYRVPFIYRMSLDAQLSSWYDLDVVCPFQNSG